MTSSGGDRKSAEAFRTISEVAELLKLPQHVLRFWETRFTQIKPLKRAGGRRFYRPEDVELLGAIRLLLYGEGYTIKGVQRLLREQGARAVAGLAQRPEGLPPRAMDEGPEEDETAEVAALEAEAADAEAAEPEPAPRAGDSRRHDADDLAAMLAEALDELATCRRLLAEAD